MKQMREVQGDMKWIQPSLWKMNYELCAGEEVVGTLCFRKVLRVRSRPPKAAMAADI